MAVASVSTSLTATSSTLQPNSLAMIFAVSESSVRVDVHARHAHAEQLHEDVGRLDAHLAGELLEVTCSSILTTFLCDAISCVET
jgi:hypothetical protein